MTPYYEKDGITIFHGDNCDVLCELERETVDLVVTSPPYDDLRTYGGHSWDFYGVAWLLKRVLKPGGVIVWVSGDQCDSDGESGSTMRQILHIQSIGLKLHDTMVYEKHAMRFPDATRYYQIWEYMAVMSKGNPKTYNPIEDRRCERAGEKVNCTERNMDGSMRIIRTDRRIKECGVRYNIWKYANVPGASTEDGVSFRHPAIFPEDLARDHILSWSNEGDTVLDPFNGSGTTTKMARELGRNGIGIDVNREYCDIAVSRLRQNLLQLTG